MKKFIIASLLFISINLLPQAQTKAADSVVINVGNASKITFVIKDKKDLETLKSYNFQSLMDDLITKIESKDTASAMKPSVSYLKDSVNSETQVPKTEAEEENWKRPEGSESNYSNQDNDITEKERKYYRGTRQSVSFDFGTNNYLSGNKFPDAGSDLYTVRPWGSWYLAANSVHRTRMARVFFLEWGFGLSLYNFKFQNDAVAVSSDANTVNFAKDTREVDFRKSKMSALFLNTSFVPVLDFGGNRRKPVLFDGRRSDSFRIGIGPYAGYRLDSYSKMVFKENGDKQREKDHDSFHLNNFRYGLRLQFGFKDTDFFFNYDLNELFASNKGPKLNAFSFGVSF
jgi:hypothetical protein